jgi:hypothetical protein
MLQQQQSLSKKNKAHGFFFSPGSAFYRMELCSAKKQLDRL